MVSEGAPFRYQLDGSFEEVPRIRAQELSVARFVNEYLAQNRPVVVTGALDEWGIDEHWTPRALEGRFGEQMTQVYNNYFDLQGLMSLSDFLTRHFGASAASTSSGVPYVRWYTQLRDVQFYWADDVFEELADHWRLPSFLPDRGYVLPWSIMRSTSPVRDAFPSKGLFISPRGARTSLHVDPWGSCAVLCQLYGRKLCVLYSPEQAPHLSNDVDVVDIALPNLETFTSFPHARITAICRLEPGEIIYFPHGWYHHVESETDAISLTWNFVHRTTVRSFRDYLERSPLSEFDQSVLRFFYRLPSANDVGGQVIALLDAISGDASSG